MIRSKLYSIFKMDIFSAAAVCITVSILSGLLRENGEVRAVLTLSAVGLLLVSIIAQFSQIKDMAQELFDMTDLDGAYFKIMFKALGIGYISKLAADCCRDSGQSALATQAEMIGRVAITIISLPLFRAVIDIIGALLS